MYWNSKNSLSVFCLCMACFAIKKTILFLSSPALIYYDQLMGVFFPAVVTLA